ncbi:MAG TPA: hypothetical protein VJ453_14915, partial [Terriglobales bacterium]|nr:hypothetical protein [Terriglobales bacterium]
FLVSGIALEQVALFVFVVAIAWRAHLRTAWVAGTAAIGLAAALMMFRISSPLWSLPKMQFVQFPWRWMLVLNLALCLTGMLALTKARMKWVWAVLIVAFLGFTERHVIRQATWGKRSVAEIYWSTSQDGYRGAKEYLPHEVHLPPTPYLLPNAPIAELKCEIPCSADSIKVTHWAEEEKKIQVASATPALLILKLYDYPAWKVRIDGAETPHESTYSGQLKIDLPPGRHQVEVDFTRTPDRTLGIVISLVSAVMLGVLAFFSERRRDESTDRTSNRQAEPAISS